MSQDTQNQQGPSASHHTQIFYGMAGVGLIAAALIGFWIFTLYQQVTELTSERNQMLASHHRELTEANKTITSLEDELDTTRDTLNDLADDYRDEKNRNEDFEDQIRDLAGTLKDVKKLQNTDEELLAKYSKVFFLNENYVPSRLKQIRSRYILDRLKDDDHHFHAEAIGFLEDMLDEAKDDGHDLKVVSAYRSFDEQHHIKGQFTSVYGEGANAFSADQGYSEHQLGTTVDLTTPEVGGTYQSFGDTQAFEWLEKNAHKYGFILSYPEGNEFYIYEPWHWRFVGRDLAKDLNRSSRTTFYTMDQREINDYLLEIFD